MKILMNITHGYQARMLLRTEISERVREAGCELLVLSPNATESYLQQELSAPGYILEQMPLRYSKVEKAVASTRAYVLMNPDLGATLHYKRERYKRAYPTRARVSRAINLLLGRFRSLRRLYLAAEARAFAGREFDAILERERPDLVVAGTPGFNTFDGHVIRAAQRLGIPSVTVMLSWDNLTSKGYMSAQPDYLLVWSDLMREEAVHYHDYRGEIIEVGAAQFDVYPKVRRTLDVEAFKRAQGVPSTASLIVWGTINNDIYPRQLDLLRRFAAELDEQQHRDVFLWVRIHPQTVSGPHRALIEAYRALECDRIKVELPPVQSEQLRWDLPKHDLEHLARLLTSADMVITPRSTLTIDAACAGTPVVNLAIDRDFAVGFNYTHYQGILRHDGAWVVNSFNELMEAVAKCLADPSNREAGRRTIVEEQLGRWYGMAGARTASVLLTLAANRRVEHPTQVAGSDQGPR